MTDNIEQISGNELNNINKKKRSKSKVKAVLITLIVIFIFFNFSFYMAERRHWINKDHAHLKAKEYFVFAEMVFLYRKMLNAFAEVDNPVMYPLNKLHEAIYKKGIPYLPPDDGERAVWRYKYDLYFYSRHDYIPNDGTPEIHTKISPLRVKILNDTYEVLKTLATKPIADSEMNEIRYKIFPLVASYYGTKKSYIFGNEHHPDVTLTMLGNNEHIEREYKLVYWLIMLKSQWEKYPSVINTIKKAEPQIEMFDYMARLRLLEKILLQRLKDYEFSCHDYYTNLYMSTRKELLDFLDKVKGRIREDQRILVYEIEFRTYLSMKLAYQLTTFCSIPPDKGYPDDKWIKEEANDGHWDYSDSIKKSIERDKKEIRK